MKAFLYLAAGLAAIAAPAGAVTINLDKVYNAPAGSASVYFVDNDFTLPVGFTNAVLTITNFYADDRGVVQLNGTIVDNGGIFGPGSGSLTLTPGGPNDPFTYTRGNGVRNVTINTGFVAGLNSFRTLVNDTNNGIFGAPLSGVNISATGIEASISFDIGPAVPEPASWAMMIAGFGMLGAAARRQRKAAVA